MKKEYIQQLHKLWGKGCHYSCQCECHKQYTYDKKEHPCWQCKDGKEIRL